MIGSGEISHAMLEFGDRAKSKLVFATIFIAFNWGKTEDL
jgi:hypothetical protein